MALNFQKIGSNIKEGADLLGTIFKAVKAPTSTVPLADVRKYGAAGVPANPANPLAQRFPSLKERPPSSTTITPPGNASSVVLDTSNAPVNGVSTTNVKSSASSSATMLTQIQEQLNSIQTQTNELGGGDTETQSTQKEPNYLEQLLGTFKKGNKAISSIPQAPSLEEERNRILGEFGLTPQSFQRVSGLTSELNSVNEQLNALEIERQSALSRTELTPGGTIAGFGAEETRLNREFSFREAGLAAKGAFLSAEISTLSGFYDKATEAAQDYVTFATAERRQIVSDIQYSMDFYKDIYLEMDKSDRDRVSNALDYNLALLKQEEDSYWKDMNYSLDSWKAEQQYSGQEQELQNNYIQEKATSTIAAVDKLIPEITNFTAGLGSLLNAIPGTEAANVRAALDQVKGLISFSELQKMRNASPTGGALGQVAIRELELLESALGALDQRQSKSALIANLKQIKSSMQQLSSIGVTPGGTSGGDSINTSMGEINPNF